MKNSTFNRISFLYDLVEEKITNDYNCARKHIDKYLPIKKTDKIADIGSGTCKVAEIIKDKSTNIINLDPSIALLKQNKQKNIIKIQSSGTDIPIKNEIFDRTLLINSLHHINRKYHKKVFSELYRILKDDGILFIIDLKHPRNFGEKMSAILDTFTSGGKTFYYTVDEIKYNLKKTGFKNITQKKVLNNKSDGKTWRYIITAEK